MKFNKFIVLIIGFLMLFGAVVPGCNAPETSAEGLALYYSLDEEGGSVAKDSVSGKNYTINYVFGQANADKIFKETSDPLRRPGVKGNALYMDGFSNNIINTDYTMSTKAISMSAWVAPRVFENIVYYDGATAGAGHTRLTSILNKGDIEMGEGFLLGYGRLGLWGIQLALHNSETDEDFVIGFYDPLNALPLYQWSHVAVTFDGTTGYIALFFNGTKSYEALIPELVSTRIIKSEEPLRVGSYVSPQIEFGVDRQMVSGLLDEVRIYSKSLTPKEVRELYNDTDILDGTHPNLDFENIALDSSVYAGDRYRPQYHAIPPAVWMNEPHSPFYYKGMYHVFYQHNPAGPYWSQIRWGHLVSEDMVHWKYVKDAVVPTAGICPEGIWTGGACIGPDGTPWLAITAGTNLYGNPNNGGQNVAFAHAADPNDPYLTDWIVEDKLVITQTNDGSQGRREQFRDPFVWYDDGTYYMVVSTSVPDPHKGGSGAVFTSKDMREWNYRGFLYQCPSEFIEQGRNWECVVMFPISTKDGSQTKYILFNCPQYEGASYEVECWYWIGTFDKNTCRFIPDNHKPERFDLGRAIYTGQNGFCFLTEEDIANGKTNYEQGRTVIYSIAQGKDAGTVHNKNSGWAHNYALPLELWLSDDGKEVIREPIKELESVRMETLYSSSKEMTATELNQAISSIRGDTLEIRAKIKINPTSAEYRTGLYVRYNPNVVNGQTERTAIVFSNTGVYIDRNESTLKESVEKRPSWTWNRVKNEYDVRIFLDRSMLEVYVDGLMSFTTRIYPKYGNSDYLKAFEVGAGLTFSEFTVYKMGSAYGELVPSYYGNVGNLGE